MSSWYSNESRIQEDLESYRGSGKQALLLFVVLAAALIVTALVIERQSEAPVRSASAARVIDGPAPLRGLGR